MQSAQDSTSTRRALLLLPFVALIVIHPLLIHGISCGQDMGFHTQSWLDAAQQLRHGHYPRWAFTPAWNAGEPRFIFYPPISWLIGALLTMVLPISTVHRSRTSSSASPPQASAMHHLARHYVSPNAALLASAFYIANPYMLFNAFERTAFAELLAAAWIPLLLLAVLRTRPTIRGIAIPIALLWLTNAPAAVMGCYTFALIAAIRVVLSVTSTKSRHPERSAAEPKDPDDFHAHHIVYTFSNCSAPHRHLHRRNRPRPRTPGFLPWSQPLTSAASSR